MGIMCMVRSSFAAFLAAMVQVVDSESAGHAHPALLLHRVQDAVRTAAYLHKVIAIVRVRNEATAEGILQQTDCGQRPARLEEIPASE